MIPVRLAKYLTNALPWSRRQIRQAWEEGRVEVYGPGEPAPQAYDLGEVVFEDDTVVVDDQTVAMRAPQLYVALNKPAGVLTTVSDPHGRPDLGPWLEALPAGAFPVGRLDRATTGFLLLTDDGDLSYLLTHPEFHVLKEYQLAVHGHVDRQDPRLERLRQGVEIGDGIAAAVSLRVTSWTREVTNLRMGIDEGRNRQIRRMCKVGRLPLKHLHRARLGPLSLGPVGQGEVRVLENEEVAALWDDAGGRATVRARKIAALQRLADRRRIEGTPHARLEAWLKGDL